MYDQIKEFLEAQGWKTEKILDNDSFFKEIPIQTQQMYINGHPVENKQIHTFHIQYIGEGEYEGSPIWGLNFGGDDEWMYSSFDDFLDRYHEIFDKITSH